MYLLINIELQEKRNMYFQKFDASPYNIRNSLNFLN